METAGEVATILAEAERKLGELMAKALRQRDYAGIQRLSAITERVAAAASAGASIDSPGHQQPPQKTKVDQLSMPSPGSTRPVPALLPLESKPFPQFYRNGNQLVKVGYSKSERRTYEHRAPREVLDRLATLLGEIGAAGRQFATDSLLPPVETRLKDVPSYQVYLCLAFLIRGSFVRRQGRAGYTVVGGLADELRGAVASAWNAVEEWTG